MSTDGVYMENVDALTDAAITLFEADESTAISTVAEKLRNRLARFDQHGLAVMLSLSVAEKAHALHHGDWA